MRLPMPAILAIPFAVLFWLVTPCARAQDLDFTAVPKITVGANPRGVAGGDFNNDGKPDLVVANLGSNNLSILLGNGFGGFAPAPASPIASAGAISVAVGDFNGDRKQDLAVGSLAGNVSILLGDGAGGFALGPGSPVATGAVSKLTIGHFDGDTNLDVAVTLVAANQVAVLLGDGLGGLGAPTSFPTGLQPVDIALIDVNQDGIRDLVALNRMGNSVTLLQGNGSGAFTPTNVGLSGGQPVALGVGRLNGNATPDIAVASGAPDLQILESGTGLVFVLLAVPRGVAVADIDLDGLFDVVVAEAGVANAGQVEVFTGRFVQTGIPTPFAFSTGATDPSAIAAVDVDADGRPDIVVAHAGSNELSIGMNRTAFPIVPGGARVSFGPARTFPTGDRPSDVAAGDLNGDGNVDVVTANAGTNDSSIFLGDGTGDLDIQPIITTNGLKPLSVTMERIDGDAFLDVAYATTDSDAFSILFGDGDGTFQPPVVEPTGPAPVAIAVGDLTGDATPDIAVASQVAGGVEIFSNDGSGNFSLDSFVPTGLQPVGIVLADVTRDNLADLIALNAGSRTVTTNPGLAGGGLGPVASTLPVGPHATALAVVDFNNDGFPDFAVAEAGGVRVFKQTALLSFQDAVVVLPYDPTALAIVRAGGRPHIAVAGPQGAGLPGLLTTLVNDGQGNFAVGHVTTTGGVEPTALAAADLTGDGRDDVLVTNGLSNTLAVLLNTTRLAPPFYDYDGDGKTDIGVYRRDTSEFFLALSRAGVRGPIGFGSFALRDEPVGLDTNGDGATQIGVFRATDGGWFIDDLDVVLEPVARDATHLPLAVGFGAPGDRPVPADYDGDGKTDLAVFRPSTAEWFIAGSASGVRGPIPFGAPGDLPVPADYDGDGKADLAVFRPSTFQWFIFGTTAGFNGPVIFGGPGDIPVPADYDGDGKTDLAVFRPATAQWFVFGSTTGFTGAVTLGTAGDLPVPADYDGDSKADLAVFRPSTAQWFIFGSATGFSAPITFGAAGDFPLTLPLALR